MRLHLAFRAVPSLVAVLLAVSFAGAAAPPRLAVPYAVRAPDLAAPWGTGAWAAAPEASFLKGEAPCQARALWSREGLYVALRTVEATPVPGAAQPGEALHFWDVFELFVDPVGDHLQFYEIQIDLAGRTYIRNHVLTAPPRLLPSGRFDQPFIDSQVWRYALPAPEGFRAASVRDPKTGVWTAACFLPAAFVDRRRGGGPLAPGAWRANFARCDWDLPREAPGRRCRFSYWAPVPDGEPHITPTLMGYLDLTPL